MSALREAANKMLKMLEEASLADPALAAEIIYKIGAALPSFRAALAQEQDAELSAALGWPGGISTPALDRKRLLQMVAALRVSAQQALEALEEYQSKGAPFLACDGAVDALRAALAQEQAGPKPMHPELRKMWEEHFDRCFRAMPLPAQEQAEPLNLSDRAVQRRLAAQWGYVPAEQAEPAVTADMRSAVRFAPSSAYWSERLREFFGPDAREGIDALERRLAEAQEPKGSGNLPPPLQAEPDLSRCPQCNGPADNGHDRSVPPSPYLCTSCMAEPVQEPVAWAGYDLDSMAEAFSRVIEAHHSNRHPFHNPLDMDARMALRILRGFLPAMKAFTAPPRRTMVPLTEEDLGKLYADWYKTPAAGLAHFARAVEKASWEKNK